MLGSTNWVLVLHLDDKSPDHWNINVCQVAQPSDSNHLLGSLSPPHTHWPQPHHVPAFLSMQKEYFYFGITESQNL